jgi:Terminase large subunit, T4likevirus-type, N-terminal
VSVIIPPEMIPNLVRAHLAPRKTPDFSLTLPVPYADWQRTMMNAPLRLMVFVLGTKCGKTLGGATRISRASFLCPPEQAGLFRIIAPTYALSGITFRYLERMFPERCNRPEGFSEAEYARAAAVYDAMKPERSTSKLWMRWPHNGALIKCVHAQDPETTIEGERVHGGLLDEASKMPEQTYASHLSTTSQTGGWTVITTTPRGKNWVYKLYMEIEEHMRWAAKTGRPLEMFCARARTVDNPTADVAAIEQARRTLPDRLFRQLYEAEFVDDGAVFVGIRELCEGNPIVTGEREFWIAEGASEREVILAGDWARVQDYTVITAWDPSVKPARMVGFLRFQGMNYRTMIKQAYEFGKHFKEVLLLRHDKTGVGDVIDELLSQLPWPIEGITFTNESKAHMVNLFTVAAQHKKMRLPYWETMLQEMDNFEVTTNELGRMKFSAPSGLHDDIVCSMILGWSAVEEMSPGAFEVQFVEDLKVSSIGGGYDSFDDTDDGDDTFRF